MKAVAKTLGVARSNLIDRLQGRSRPRRGYHKAEDADLVPQIMVLVAARPTYGYRRITAILNRQLRSNGAALVNHKRIYRIMKSHNLLLARKYSERPEHVVAIHGVSQRRACKMLAVDRSSVRYRSVRVDGDSQTGDVRTTLRAIGFVARRRPSGWIGNDGRVDQCPTDGRHDAANSPSRS